MSTFGEDSKGDFFVGVVWLRTAPEYLCHVQWLPMIVQAQPG
jgi:hypothetical protein